MKSYPHDFWSERRNNEFHVWGLFLIVLGITIWIGTTLCIMGVNR